MNRETRDILLSDSESPAPGGDARDAERRAEADRREEADRRRRRRIRLLVALAFVLPVAFVVVLLGWTRRERGPDLAVSLSAIVPASHCIAYGRFESPGAFLARAAGTPAARAWFGEDLSLPVSRAPRRQRPSAMRRHLDSLASRLGVERLDQAVERLVGSDIELIVLKLDDFSSSESDGNDFSKTVADADSRFAVPSGATAVLLGIRPRLGWRGALATCLGPFAGGTRIRSHRESGARFYSRPHPRHPDRGIALARLGSTVLIRLDSPDPAPFRRVLDWGGLNGRSVSRPAAAIDTAADTVGGVVADSAAYRRLETLHGEQPGLRGFLRPGPGVALFDPFFPEGGLWEWVEPAWRPALQEELDRRARVEIAAHLDARDGFRFTFDWVKAVETEDIQEARRRERESSPRAAAHEAHEGHVGHMAHEGHVGHMGHEGHVGHEGRHPAADSAPASSSLSGADESGVRAPLASLEIRSRRIPEFVRWSFLVAQSIERAKRDDDDKDDETALGRPDPAPAVAAAPPLSPAEKAARRLERKRQKERRRALVRELTHPLAVGRLVAGLAEHPSPRLEIADAGFDSDGDWIPDWRLIASVADESVVRHAVSEYFRSVERRESAATLLPFPSSPTEAVEREDGAAPPTMDARSGNAGGARALLETTEPLYMDLREGRLVVSVPGDDTVRLELRRHRPDAADRRDARGGGLVSAMRAIAPERPVVSEEATPLLSFVVDWPCLVAHLDDLLIESGRDPGLPSPSAEVALFRVWAGLASYAGAMRFSILEHPDGARWTFEVPLRPD